MQKRFTTWITLVGLALLAVYLFGYNPMVVFSTTSKLIIHPSEEWELAKTIDGNLISIHKNHIKNYVENYSVTEFQRGDAVRFVLNPSIFDRDNITQGDTIGFVYSNEEQRRLIQLKGQLGVLYSELEFHTTGQKPEDVALATRNLELAQQELETQRKLMLRSEELIKDNVISKEQYDIDFNELKVKEMRMEMAKANLASIDTGEKPEMEKLVRSKIDALSLEIDQIQNRMDLFTVVSPISGRVTIDHGSMLTNPSILNSETIVKIISNDNPVGLLPIRIKHHSALSLGSKVKFRKTNQSGKVVLINNTAQISVSSPYIFYVVELDKTLKYTIGEIQDVVIYGSKIPFTEFLSLHLTR